MAGPPAGRARPGVTSHYYRRRDPGRRVRKIIRRSHLCPSPILRRRAPAPGCPRQPRTWNLADAGPGSVTVTVLTPGLTADHHWHHVDDS